MECGFYNVETPDGTHYHRFSRTVLLHDQKIKKWSRGIDRVLLVLSEVLSAARRIVKLHLLL